MPDILAFDVLSGLNPQSVFISAGVEIWCGCEQLDGGRVFLASRRGLVAACASFSGTYAGGADLTVLAKRGQLSARAVVDFDGNGLAIVSRVHLLRNQGSRAWIKHQPASMLEGHCRAWAGDIIIAGMAQGSRSTLPVPSPDRPLGEGEPTVIDLRGDIGCAGNTAERVRAFLGNPERVHSTVLVNIDSSGGACGEGLKIYRALAGWPFAVYARIRRAESMAAVSEVNYAVRDVDVAQEHGRIDQAQRS